MLVPLSMSLLRSEGGVVVFTAIEDTDVES